MAINCTWHGCALTAETIDSKRCILHDPNAEKSESKFTKALEEKIRVEEESDADAIDLSGVVFPSDADFKGRAFKKDVSFFRAQFSGAAHFRGAQFSGGADFWRAQFSGDTGFRDAQFSRDAYFSRITVQETLTFQGQTFLSTEANASMQFQNLTGESARRIRFEGANLSHTSFLRTDVSQTRFVGCAWARKNGRNTIYDELAGEDPSLVADTYRQLRLNYESNRQEAEAGGFYVGQMEMRRQDKVTYSWLYRSLLGVYRVLAMYGESYQRPVFFYFTLGLLFALLYLWGGFQVGDMSVRYNLGFDLGNLVQFGKDFVRAYVQALTAGGILGANLAGLSGVNLASGECGCRSLATPTCCWTPSWWASSRWPCGGTSGGRGYDHPHPNLPPW